MSLVQPKELGALIVLGLAAAVLCGGLACSKGQVPHENQEVVVRKPELLLPSPFSSIRIGASREEILRTFPPVEKIAACEVPFIGGDLPVPLGGRQITGNLASFCPQSSHVVGFSAAESENWRAAFGNARKSIDEIRGYIYTAAQIRGALRAGAVTAEDVVRACPEGTVWDDAVFMSAAVLYDGATAFVRPQQARRTICVTARPMRSHRDRPNGSLSDRPSGSA
jgi:hypothetical protein